MKLKKATIKNEGFMKDVGHISLVIEKKVKISKQIYLLIQSICKDNPEN